ncbi:MAG TPA: single-stranded DNA-binding protein [Patescibacteria group bacterium]
MFSLNRATLIGNLTRDPELRQTPSGQSVASFAVATNRRWTTQQGDTQDATEFHEVVAWGKLAEISEQLLGKGKKVYIEGRLQTRTWDAPDGSKRQRTEIIAENIIALSPKGGEGMGGGDSFPSTQSKTTKAKSASQDAPAATGGDEIDLSDLPF